MGTHEHEDPQAPSEQGPSEQGSSDEGHADGRHPDEIVTAEVVGETPPGPGLDVPDDPEEAVTVLSAALMEARALADRYLDDYRRMTADFDNYRKRAQRDQAEVVSRASERVLANLLPVLDTFDMALTMPAESEGEEKMLGGMQSTHGQLLSILANEGLTPIPTVGEPFDPNVHEAVQMAEGSGTMYVTAEVRRGYRLGDRVLRAALVAVGYEEVTAEA